MNTVLHGDDDDDDDDIPFLFSVCFHSLLALRHGIFTVGGSILLFHKFFDTDGHSLLLDEPAKKQKNKKNLKIKPKRNNFFYFSTTNLLLVAKTPATRHGRTQFYHRCVPVRNENCHS